MARQAPVAGDLRPVTAPLQANDRSAQLGCLAALAELVDRQVAEAADALSDATSTRCVVCNGKTSR